MSRTKFYTLPVECITAGMSTADGQDVVQVGISKDKTLVFFETYTPRSDDPEQDEENRNETTTQARDYGERVWMGVFSDTKVDGSKHESAKPIPRG